MVKINQTLNHYQEEFSKPEWETIGLSFSFVFGYVSFVATIPSLLSPAEWLETFAEEIELDLYSPLGIQFQKLSIQLFNELRREIGKGIALFPQNLLNPEMELIGAESSLGQWSIGFSIGVKELGHLWQIACSNVQLTGIADPWQKTKAQWVFFELFSTSQRVDLAYQAMGRTDDKLEFSREVQRKLPAMWGQYCKWFSEFWKALDLSKTAQKGR